MLHFCEKLITKLTLAVCPLLAESGPLDWLIECSLLGDDKKVLDRGEYLNVLKPYYSLINSGRVRAEENS